MSDEEALKKTEVQDNLDEQLDEQLLAIIKGKVTVLGARGKPVKITPSPQYFEITRRRLKDLRKSGEAEGDNSAASRLADELERDPDRLKMHNVPEFIAEPAEEPETAVG